LIFVVSSAFYDGL